jgi:glutathionyl-hydroquinone reductase
MSTAKPDAQCRELFDSLDKVESILSKSRFLAGNQLTEADVRLFMTLIRFDEVGRAIR